MLVFDAVKRIEMHFVFGLFFRIGIFVLYSKYYCIKESTFNIQLFFFIPVVTSQTHFQTFILYLFFLYMNYRFLFNFVWQNKQTNKQTTGRNKNGKSRRRI
jgi:hypothetical protein